MIFDMQSLFSDKQAITASAVSTNVIDQGPVGTPIGGSTPLRRDLGAGGPVPIRIQVVEAFATLTSLQVQIQTSDVENFGSGVDTIADSGAIAVAALIQGYVFTPQFMPNGANKRFLRLNYVVAGTDATLGTVIAGLVFGNQTN